jgi:hypothetical protein
MRRALMVLGLAIAVSACLGAESAPPEEMKPYVEPKTGVTFPLKVGPLELKKTVTFDKPGLGVAIRYGQTEPVFVKADIYIYDLGRANLGTGIGNKAVQAAFEGARADIQTMVDRGQYAALKPLPARPVSLKVGGKPLPMLTASYEFAVNPPPGSAADAEVQVSHLLVTAFKDQFLKIRFSYPKEGKAEGDKAFKQFLDALGPVLGPAIAPPGKGGKADPKGAAPPAPSKPTAKP